MHTGAITELVTQPQLQPSTAAAWLSASGHLLRGLSMSPPAGISAVWTMVWVTKKHSATKWALEGSNWAAESGGVVR